MDIAGIAELSTPLLMILVQFLNEGAYGTEKVNESETKKNNKKQ